MSASSSRQRRPPSARRVVKQSKPTGKPAKPASKPAKAPVPPGGSVLSALAILPPEELCEQIQAIRQVHDKSFHRWMPHLNLLFPWVLPVRFDEEASSLTELLASFPPFTLRLQCFQEFVTKVKPHSSWLSLRPEVIPDASTPRNQGPNYLLIELFTRIEQLYPLFKGQHDAPMGFRAHLTVGQLSGDGHAAVREKIEGDWRPIEWRVDRIHLLSRDSNSPFRVAGFVKLGSALPSSLPAAPSHFVVPNDTLEKIALTCGQWIHRMWANPQKRASLPIKRDGLAHVIAKYCEGRVPLISVDDILQELLARGVFELKGTSVHLINYKEQPEEESSAASSSSLTASPASPYIPSDCYDIPILTFEAALQKARLWIENPNCKARPRTVDALKSSLKPLLLQFFRVEPYRVIRLLEQHKAIDVLPNGNIQYA